MLSQILSGSYEQNEETQNFGSCQDYQLFSQSQSQSSQQLEFHQNQIILNTKKEQLTIIEEEDNYNSQLNLSQKQVQLSQQIDQLYSDSQKNLEENNKNQFNYYVQDQNMNPNINKNDRHNTTGYNQMTKTPNSKGLDTKKGSTKKSTTNMNNSELSFSNQNILNDFKSKMNDHRASLVGLFNEAKQRFCDLADKNLSKLIDNMNHIETILTNDTENTLHEEMRNKIIDQKIDLLFKEIFNLLNDLSSKH